MNQQEKELFRSLCSFKAKNFDKTLLDAASSAVLGQLFFNRMQAVAYGTLKKHGLLGEVNREFRNSLKAAYEQNLEKNESFFWCVQHAEEILSAYKFKYAMLKGSQLCKSYPDAYRTSNDIDLLVHPKDITQIGEALLKAGFKQGSIKSGEFKPATRNEIIESKIMRGETVPYIKEINLPYMKFLEIDINFSLDYKPDNTPLLKEMINNSELREIKGLRFHTLKNDDFFIHLCSHLYKEATTLPWVQMMRDMTLYKYCDIYMLLNDIDENQTRLLFEKAKKTDTEKICAFAVLQTSKLFTFENKYAVTLAQKILKTAPDFIHTVISPKDKKTYIFKQKNISKRFFANDRMSLLKEVK